MKITHCLYNSFLLEDGNDKIALDPGGLCLNFFRLTTLIPKSEWKENRQPSTFPCHLSSQEIIRNVADEFWTAAQNLKGERRSIATIERDRLP